MTETSIPVTCNRDCGGGCPLLAEVENGHVVKIKNNPLGSPYMAGCVRGLQMTRVLYAKDRLTKPLLRTGPRGSGQFKEVEWAEALDLVAEKLKEIKSKYGNEAILRLGGSGANRGALHQTRHLTSRFLNMFGGYIEVTGGYSNAAGSYVTPFMLGTEMAGIDAETLKGSNMIILWGANIVDTRLGCEMEAAIREAKTRGIPVIVIDPRRSNTVSKLGTQWIQVRPGTDTALMMAVLYILLTENLIDRAFVDKYSEGFLELEKYVLGHANEEAKTPEWAEAICGTPTDTIVNLARQYGQIHPTTLIPGLSIQRTIGGEEAIRMTIALQVATGNLGKLGGSTGAITWSRLPKAKMGQIKIPPNPIEATVPVYRWSDVILEGKSGGYPSDIKAIYNVGGNYLVQGSDIHKNIRAFKSVEFSVCHEYFLTPTAQHCDIILPVTTFLERDDIIFPQSGNYLLYSHQVESPLFDARNDYDIFCQLASRLGFLSEYSEEKTYDEWFQSFIAASEIDDYETFKRTGIYMGKDQMRVGLSEFVADPQTHPLNTPSGRVQISSAAYAENSYSPFPTCRILQITEQYPLRMVTPKSKYRVHSQNANIPWFVEREKPELWINPQDATKRGIENSQVICISSPEGQVHIGARVTEDIMEGVVCLLEGMWPSFDNNNIDTAGSPNILTSTEPTQPSKGSRTHSVLVEVTRI